MADQQKQQLKRERVSLEHDIDQKLLALCKIDMSRDIETGVHAVEGDIEALLQALQKVNEELMSMDCSTVERQQNEYHREIIQGYYQDLKTTKAKMKYRFEKEALLKNCQKDIEEFKTGAAALGKERDAIGKVGDMANQILAIGESSRERLQAQRSTFGSILDKSGTLIKKLPVVNDIIQKIHKKKSRDMIILSGVIGLCLFLCWLYWK
uniref:Golgi SNAP receptor complex member 1 n=1 Tax=Eutreptiella gymnastica TaxID=73025 RepID=A0A6T1ZEE1_9EUGL